MPELAVGLARVERRARFTVGRDIAGRGAGIKANIQLA